MGLHRSLLDELTAAGCFRRAPLRSAIYGAGIAGGYAAAYALLLTAPPLPLRIFACVLLAFLCVQAAFLAHEAGHGAISGNRALSVCVGQVFNTLLTGLSYSYYRHVHREHHRYTNERGRDPDIQSELFGLYAESARAKRGLGRCVARHQSVLIWLLVWLQGLTFKLDSIRYLAGNARRTRADQLVLVAHYALWFVLPVVVLGPADALCNYAVMTLFIGGYTGSIFIVNHVGTRVIEPHESLPFALHEIAVTRNLGTSLLEHFVFGGLNNHIEHHLFPSMPTARLRTARAITSAFCRRHGIAYRETSWFGALREVTRAFAGHVRAGPDMRPYIAVAVMILLGGCSIRQAAVDRFADVVAEGGTSYATDDDPELVRAAAPFSLKLTEGLLAATPHHKGLLLAAARGFTQYAYAFVQQEAEEVEDRDVAASVALQDRARRLYRRARDYGLRGLGLDVERLRVEPRRMLATLPRSEVGLLYWTGAAWGASIGLSKSDPEALAELPIVEALIDRALELDEGYERGAIHTFLIGYEMARQDATGDPAMRARRHFTRSLELSASADAAPYVALAEAVCVPQQLRGEFQALLAEALRVENADNRLSNLVMQRRSRWLLARTERLFID